MDSLAAPSFENALTVIGALIFGAALICAFFAHFALIGALRRRGVEVSFLLWGSQLFLLQFEYLKNRWQPRDPKLDWLARSAIVAPSIGLAALLAAFVF